MLWAAVKKDQHVRVVIRTHRNHVHLVQSLIWGLRSQVHPFKGVTIDFVLVPTEPGTLSTLDAVERGECCWRKRR